MSVRFKRVQQRSVRYTYSRRIAYFLILQEILPTLFRPVTARFWQRITHGLQAINVFWFHLQTRCRLNEVHHSTGERKHDRLQLFSLLPMCSIVKSGRSQQKLIKYSPRLFASDEQCVFYLFICMRQSLIHRVYNRISTKLVDPHGILWNRSTKE